MTCHDQYHLHIYKQRNILVVYEMALIIRSNFKSDFLKIQIQN